MSSETQNMNTRVWSNKKIIKFIKEVHMRPELWNVSVSAYRNRKAKFNAWSDVAAQFNITPDVAYKKFRNLRTYAQTEHKKKGGRQNISWFAYDAISFIWSESPDKDTDNENNTKSSIDREDDDSSISESSNTSPEPQTKESLKKEIKTQILEPIERVHLSEDKGRNPYTSFGEYVANKLNTYDSYTRAQAEFKISKVLYEADMGMLRHTERQFPPQFATVDPNYSEQGNMSRSCDVKGQSNFLSPQDSFQVIPSSNNH